MLDSYALCMCNSTLFDIEKKILNVKIFFIFFECILDRVRGVGRGPVHWGQCFAAAPLMSHYTHSVLIYIVRQLLLILFIQKLLRC